MTTPKRLKEKVNKLMIELKDSEQYIKWAMEWAMEQVEAVDTDDPSLGDYHVNLSDARSELSNASNAIDEAMGLIDELMGPEPTREDVEP